MENFDDEFLPPITQQYNPSEDDSPTPLRAILFLVITIFACCNFSISGAIGNYIDTGELSFPVANIKVKYEYMSKYFSADREMNQAKTSIQRIGYSSIFISIFIFEGKNAETSKRDYRLFLILFVVCIQGFFLPPDTRIDFNTDKALFWFEFLYNFINISYTLMAVIIFFIYFFYDVLLIRVQGSRLQLLIFIWLPFTLAYWLMVSFLPTL